MTVAGKGAIVTGAGKGLGRATVAGLVRNSCQDKNLGCCLVVGITRSQEDCDSLEKEFPGKVVTVCADLGKDAAGAMDQAIKKLGSVPLYFLVNNAGINIMESVMEVKKESWEEVMCINAYAPIVCTQKAVRRMVQDSLAAVGGANAIANGHGIANGNGVANGNHIAGANGSIPEEIPEGPVRCDLAMKSIVNVSSQASLFSIDKHCSYSMSKGAMDLFTKTCALELGANYGIRCNSVNPTVILTKLGRAAWGDPEKGGPMLSKIPLGKFAEEEDVVQPVLFLLNGEAAGMMNGTLMPIEGGIYSSCKMPQKI